MRAHGVQLSPYAYAAEANYVNSVYMHKRHHSSFVRRGYHHGNLKEALVDAGRQLIVEKGPHGFSLVEAARIAKVSPAAPYRHFANRDALLTEIAKRGFVRFADALEKAWDETRLGPQVAVERMGEAYLAFARQDRASYAAMFEAGLQPSSNPELEETAKRAFNTLYRVAERFHGALPDGEQLAPSLILAHIWALAHGISTLFGVRGFSSPSGNTDAQAMFKKGTEIYLKGLGFPISPQS